MRDPFSSLPCALPERLAKRLPETICKVVRMAVFLSCYFENGDVAANVLGHETGKGNLLGGKNARASCGLFVWQTTLKVKQQKRT